MAALAATPRSDAMDEAERGWWGDLQTTGRAADIARHALFARYQPLARRIAWRFYRDQPAARVELAELVQLSSVGLLEAISRYRPELGVPFRYFGPRRISGEIVDGVARLSEVNRQISVASRMRRERAQSLSAQSRTVSDLDAQLNLIGDIAAELALGLMLEDGAMVSAEDRDPAQDAYQTLAWRQAVERVQAAINGLGERERKVVALHYLDGLTFENIAKLLGLSKGRISQIHRVALSVLRKRLSANGTLRLEG